MKNEIIFSYRLIKLIYYLIALYVAITYVNEISKAICYILILVLILGCAMYIYLIIVYKIYSKSINLEKNIKKVNDAICKIKGTLINSYLKKLYCDLLEASNHTDEFYDFFEKNKDLIFGEKSYAFWYTTKLLYYYDRQEYNNYIELYNSKLNSKINSNLSEIIYYIISEEYDQALGLLKKAIKGQKGLGYIMCLYYKIICLEKLDREDELNEAVGEISKYSSEIKYVKKIKEKYLAD